VPIVTINVLNVTTEKNVLLVLKEDLKPQIVVVLKEHMTVVLLNVPHVNHHVLPVVD
jgi:hypothetical protein